MKKRYDQDASTNTFNMGDCVMLKNTVLTNNETQKFHLPYSGPYRVEEVLPPVNYVIEGSDDATKKVHFNRLKRSREKFKPDTTREGKPQKEHQNWERPEIRKTFGKRG